MHNATTKRVSDLIRDIDDGSLVLTPPFQRRLVWTNIVKDHFLETVTLGLPFPEIFIATGEIDTHSMKRKNQLVDGQQRISTLRAYVQGSPDLVLTKVTPYNELDETEKATFLDYTVAVRDLGTAGEEQIKDIFTRINSTDYALKAMERLNARFSGEYKQFCDDLSKRTFFDRHNVFSLADVRRMRDLDFCVILTTTLLSTYYHRNTLNEEYLRRYNDAFPQGRELGEQIAATLALIESCDFDRECRIWKKTDLFTLIVELHSLILKKCPLDPVQVRSRLTDFYAQVHAMFAMEGSDDDLAKKAPHPSVFRYLKAATKATNDKYARVDRAEVIGAILQSTLDSKASKKATPRKSHK
ncbi:MAG TPA: DUF262 domain-containing protein [Pirellulales bacterium]|nr:DUF262 domain-containing protein [Pirellulales bacterium]